MCRKTAEPIFLTKNGEGDRLAGRNGCTLDELDAYLELETE